MEIEFEETLLNWAEEVNNSESDVESDASSGE